MANSAARGPRSGILYQNVDQDITLMDIPTSISVAQGRSDVILSTEPLETPLHVQDEPKSSKAKTKMARDLPLEYLHTEYRSHIAAALAEIRHHVSASWCAPRRVKTHVPRRGKASMHIDDPEKELESRLREWAALVQSKGEETAFDFQRMMASLCATPGKDVTVPETVAHKWLMSYQPARGPKADEQDDQCTSQLEPIAQQEPWVSSFHNPEKYALDLSIVENVDRANQEAPEYRFTIPPRSTSFLSDSTDTDAFRASFREITDEHTLPRHFNLILMDPPWPNRSAKRKGAYEQVGGMPHVKRMLLNMDIDNYLEHNALLGVWITNKEALRTHVLGAGGLFERWNIGLIEEWIWIKTTIRGEPMFDIDSLWRKPYEILLLGRAAPNAWTTMAPAPVVKRRVIAAVPDIHSRKPCLKELLEPYMPDPNDYSALEIFSRYLVAGWTSWGNEVLKYNWDKYWASGSEESTEDFPSR